MNCGIMRVTRRSTPGQKGYPELASMLTRPPQLVGKCVRCIKDQHGETRRARARVWTDGNIMIGLSHTVRSRAMAEGLIIDLISAVENGDVGTVPKVMKVKGY
jgi:hypothetical protein